MEGKEKLRESGERKKKEVERVDLIGNALRPRPGDSEGNRNFNW